MPPPGATARARGVSPNSSTVVSGVPPSDAPRLVASNTCTSARSSPGVVRLAGTGQFCPRRAVVMKARVPPGPANTMSRGSSQSSSVRVTRGGVVPTSTMETESDRWLTTQTSVSERAATAIGSSPTGTEPVWVRPAPETPKISRRSSGVLRANRRVPSGDRASGRTCPVSNVVNAAARQATKRAAMVRIRPRIMAAPDTLPAAASSTAR